MEVVLEFSRWAPKYIFIRKETRRVDKSIVEKVQS